MFYGIIKNNICELVAIFDKEYLYKLLFVSSENFSVSEIEKNYSKQESAAIFSMLSVQLNQYFCGERKNFTIPLWLKKDSSKFYSDVIKSLIDIPFGEVCSYQKLAEKCGHPRSYRAVGTALSKNDLCLVLPCHRVIRSGGELGGYRAGIGVKQQLLQLEKSFT